jgi:hypothetical protein
LFTAFNMLAITLAVAVARRRILPRMEHESGLIHRLAIGGLSALFVAPIGMPLAADLGPGARAMPTLLGVLASMFILDWRVMLTPARPARVSLGPALAAGTVAAIVAAILEGHGLIAFGMITGIALAVQASSPFDPVASKKHAGKVAWWESLGLAFASDDVVAPAEPEPEPAMAAVMEDESHSASIAPASPQLRLAALILALLPICGVPVAGLHRFYVGKIGTGILWLFTFGLLGIGQLVDLILIILGQFRDSEERMLVAWTGVNRDDEVAGSEQLHAVPVNHYSSVPAPRRAPLRLGSLFLNLLGGVMLVVVLVLGLLLAVNVAGALSAGVLDFHPLDLNMAEDFPAPFPDLVNLIVLFITLFLATITVITLILARRGLGAMHMFRVVLASVGIFFSLFFIHLGFDFGDWQAVGQLARGDQVGPAIEVFLANNEFIPMTVLAAVTFIGSCFVLAWPARQAQSVVQMPSRRPEREVVRQ